MEKMKLKRLRRNVRLRRRQSGSGKPGSWLISQLSVIFDAVQVGLLLVDSQLRVMMANRCITEPFGGTPDGHGDSRLGFILRCPNSRVNRSGCGYSPDCPSCGLMLSLRKTLENGDPSDGSEVTLLLERDNDVARTWMRYSTRPLALAGARFALLTLMDITDLKTTQSELHRKALYDPVTSLPNRVLFVDRLERLISAMPRDTQGNFGVMLLDLDSFKAVNDTLGHDTGDRLLNTVGNRLRLCLRAQDTVARMGGDEFALLLPEVRHAVDLATVARKIMATIEAPIHLDDNEFFITASVGIACYPVDSSSCRELLSVAEVAMYHAKSMGRNNFQFYAASLTSDAGERIELEADLRKALRQRELELYYQPKVDTLIGQMVGAEALLRWRHPVRGMIPPDRFIGIAEDTGMIMEIGAWVLRCACFSIVKWNRDALYPFRVAVNLSVRQFLADDFVDIVRSTLAETGCQPDWLELEITESLFMTRKPRITATFEALDALGVPMVLDDFGTGYSSLSYLTDFPVSCIKIDKSFVRDITTRQKSLELVRGIVSMGLALGMELVAEGVETGEQAACLDKLGCHVIQGYFYGRPMPEPEFDIWRANFCSSRALGNDEITQLVQSSWRDYLTTGNALIDGQHRELFGRITRLAQACRSGKGLDEVSGVLNYLGDYVKEHFAAEEELLVSVNSPRYSEHKAAHRAFTEVIDELISRFQREGETLDLAIETNFAAIEWLTSHICGMDRDLAERLRRAGH